MYESDNAPTAHKALGVVGIGQLADDDAHLGSGGVDKLVVADVQSHMGGPLAGGALLEDDQISGLEVRALHIGARAVPLGGGGVGEAVAVESEYVHRKAGAVKAAAGRAAVGVWRPQILLGALHDAGANGAGRRYS